MGESLCDNDVVLQPLIAEDKALLFEWRNLPEIVALSTSQRKVSWEEHCHWFDDLLASTNRVSFIIECQGVPVGHIRFESTGHDEVELTIYIVPGYTAKGIGGVSIKKGLELAARQLKISSVIANVREDNLSAIQFFERSGFNEDKDGALPGHLRFVMSLENHDLAESNRLYDCLLGQYGDSYKALNWGSREGQLLRFRILSEVADLDGMRVLDVGCGLGHAYAWLKEKFDIDYYGVDINESFVRAARSKYDAEFQVMNILVDSPPGNFDCVFSSGIFYTYSKSAFDFQKKMIKRFWELSDMAVAFNSLSKWGDVESGEYAADPASVLSYCRYFTDRVALRHDYHPNDFTIYMKKEYYK